MRSMLTAMDHREARRLFGRADTFRSYNLREQLGSRWGAVRCLEHSRSGSCEPHPLNTGSLARRQRPAGQTRQPANGLRSLVTAKVVLGLLILAQTR